MKNPNELPIALITGASRGIGFAIAQKLSTNGYQTILVARDTDRLQKAAQMIESSGGLATGLACDITSSGAVAKLHEIVSTNFGTLSVLINNAGIAPVATIEMTGDALWDHTIATNLTGAFYLSRAFVPDMKTAGKGDILSIASTAALQGFKYNSAYTASKHGLLGLTRALAVELERNNIRVNALCPGFVRTDIVVESIAALRARTGKSEAEAEQSFAALNEEKRLIEPEEVASLALAVLASPSFVTGQAITHSNADAILSSAPKR